MEMLPSKRLGASTPVAIAVMTVPRDTLSEKSSIMGEVGIWIKPRQRVIDGPMTTGERSPSFSVNTRQLFLNSRRNE